MKKILILSLLTFFVIGCEKIDQLQRRSDTCEHDIKELYRVIGELKAKVENSSRPVVDTGSRKTSSFLSNVDAELQKIKASISSLEYTQQFCVRESAITTLKTRLSKIESDVGERQIGLNYSISNTDSELKKIKESISKLEKSLNELSSKVSDVESKINKQIVPGCLDGTVSHGRFGSVVYACKCRGYVDTDGWGSECEECGHDKKKHTRAIRTL